MTVICIDEKLVIGKTAHFDEAQKLLILFKIIFPRYLIVFKMPILYMGLTTMKAWQLYNLFF